MVIRKNNVIQAMCLIGFFANFCCDIPLRASTLSRYSTENYLCEIAAYDSSLKCLFDFKSTVENHTLSSKDILIIDYVLSSRVADPYKNERLLVVLSRFNFDIEGNIDLRNRLLERSRKLDSFHSTLFSRFSGGVGFKDGRDSIEEHDFLLLASKYKLTQHQISKEWIYQLVKQDREKEALALLSKDTSLLPAILDAYTMRNVSASGQKHLVDLLLASQDQYVQWAGLRFIATALEADSENNVLRLYKRLSEIDKDGREVIRTSTKIRDLTTFLFQECNRYLKLSKYISIYKKSLPENDIDSMFSVSFDDRQIAELQGMVMFQSYPELFSDFLKKYIQSNTLVLQSGMHLNLILSSAAQYDSIAGNVRGFGVLVRDRLSVASSPIVQANLLKILKVIVGKVDLPILKKLCAVGTDVEWVALNGIKYKNPIVGLWAIDCLWKLGTPEALEIILSVSESEGFSPEVREFSKRIISSQQKSLRHPSSKDNLENPVPLKSEVASETKKIKLKKMSKFEKNLKSFSTIESSKLLHMARETTDRSVREAALQLIGDRSLDGSLQLDSSDDAQVQSILADTLVKCASAKGDIRYQASSDIQRLWSLSVLFLIDHLNDEDPYKREAAVNNLVLMRNEKNIQQIIDRIKKTTDSKYKTRLILALGMMRTQQYPNIRNRPFPPNEDASLAIVTRLIFPFFDQLKRSATPPSIIDAIARSENSLNNPIDLRPRLTETGELFPPQF